MRIDLPNYNSREQSHFNESFLPSELFISTDGGRTKNKINKESDKRLDTVYLERISENGAVVVGYATESKSILDEKIKTDILPGYIHTCQGYSECYAFSYNTNSNTFTILEKNITIKHLTKDGQFILYSPTISNDKKETFIYDINKKTSIPLTIDNVNKYLSDHPEKNILLSSITEYPFFAGIKRRNVDIQKISDNGQVFIGQLNRDLSKKQLNDSHYPRIAFITTNDGPIKEISRSKFGSSKLIDISADGNYSVGWEEVWHDDYQVRLPSGIKTSSALFSQAIRYDLSQDRLINIGNLSNRQNESSYRNARATDISADGKYIVGWSETDNYNYDTIPNNANSKGVSAFTIFHRHGFVHWNNTMHDLGTLNGGKDSEAHIITDDGRIIYGLATDEHNNWRQVVWRSDQLSDEAFNAEKQRQEADNAKRIADEAEKQRKEEENKKRLALEAKQRQDAAEAKRIADEAEKQRKEEENKKRLALEAKQRQDAAEAKRIADEAEKQRKEEENKKRLALEDKQRQDAAEAKRIADEAEKQRKEEENKKRLALEAKQRQDAAEAKRIADEAEKQRKEEENKKRLALEAKQRQDAAEAKRIADEAEKQRKEEENKKRLALEAKQRQDAAEAKRIADEAEKQRKEEENKKRLALEAKQRQDAAEAKRIADEAEKQRKEEENKKRLALEAKQRQDAAEAKRIADEAEKQHQDKADKKIEEIIPVEDELEQRAKEKVKEKENTKPSIVISKPIDIENTHRSIQLMAENGYKLIDMQQGQLRYLADATCSVGTEKACISGFAHYQNINKANATQTGLSGAYRFDINQTPLVVGLAIDTDVYSSLPKGYQYQGYALPLIGFSLDLMPSLNAELNSNALHLSLKGAYLNRKVSIERQTLEDTEAGKGNAKISGYHIELQGYYPYSIADNLLLTPFAGLTFNQISRSAYSETQNAQFAAHYDALKAHSLLARMGFGMDYLLGSSFILNTKAGLLWNLSHHQGDFRSHIDYLGQQNIDYSENKKQLKQRPFAHIGLTYQVDKHTSIGTKANWEMTTYRHHDMQFGINYTYRF
ncbi:autotransporter domain-containing protein [Proteus alimentorum]|uniref:autotransporter domain-containing protein n=1 Tax=Proteus alimentorum TaxID=1973495 RepID=UPI001F0A715F|nr:autotransporter domain-containing protein [Proteus alimentorum]